LELLQRSRATVIYSTPTYALYLAEVARAESFELRELPIRKIIVAGEPGGSVPAIRQRIEAAWDAELIDHSGASEVGPWGYGDAAGKGLWVNESSFLAETLELDSDKPAQPGDLGELVLTTLGRVGSPLLRYRTGDLVRGVRPSTGPRRFLFLEGGVLGRADDMLVIRGVNIFPSSIEQILRSFTEVVEYRMTAFRVSGLDQLRVEVEDLAAEPKRIAQALENRLSLRVEVILAPADSLPRFEGKGRRFIDLRGESPLTE
jgi:phenylacetate-CoA ligase